MTRLAIKTAYEQTYSADHFGANILATRDKLGEDGTFDEAVDHLGVGTIRYPGGSLTERYFDLADPDRLMAEHYITGADQPLLPYSEFMAFAADTDRSVMIVLPTRTQLSQQADANGDRFAAIDEDTLRDFLRDTLDGFYGAPRIAGFEIGNEYWDSGQMTSVEYGRVASAMARIVKEELTTHPDFDTRFAETTVNVQVGSENGYAGLSHRYDGTAQEQLDQFSADYDMAVPDGMISSSGTIAWSKIANLLVVREFDLPEEREAVDGVIAHIYSKGEFATSSHTYELRLIDTFWHEGFNDVKPVVTEWNVRSPGRDAETDFGLVQAGEMLDLVEAMGLYDVSAAYVWAVQQGSNSNLMGNEGSPEESVGGAFFRMMSGSLPGTRAVVLNGADRQQSELALENAEAHVFAGNEQMVLYLQSTNPDETHETTVDISPLITGFDTISMTKLGVAPGDPVGSSAATPVLTELDPEAHYDNGVLSVTLAPREILQVTFDGADFSPDLMAALGEGDTGDAMGAVSMMPPAVAKVAAVDEAFWFTGGPSLEEIAARQEELDAQRAEDMPEDDGNDDLGFSADMLMFGLLLPLLMVAGGF